MKSMEQVGPDGSGTVTAACIWLAGEPTFELVVYPALLRALPWFRGGRDVAVVLFDGQMTITHPGPHRLHAKIANRLDKLPPVMLRVPGLQYLRPQEQPAEAVPYDLRRELGLVITLPVWARPPVPRSAPVTSFGPALAGGVR